MSWGKTRIEERFENEHDLRESVLETMKRWFRVEREVSGIHLPSGERLRLDAIFQPLEVAEWRDAKPAFGVEFKQPRMNFDTRGYTSWVAQAVDYANAQWDGYGRLRIFTCPSPIPNLEAAYGDGAGRLMSRLLGQLGIGELVRLNRYGWTLYLNEHRLWSETDGVAEAKRWSLRPKAGSR